MLYYDIMNHDDIIALYARQAEMDKLRILSENDHTRRGMT